MVPIVCLQVLRATAAAEAAEALFLAILVVQAVEVRAVDSLLEPSQVVQVQHRRAMPVEAPRDHIRTTRTLGAAVGQVQLEAMPLQVVVVPVERVLHHPLQEPLLHAQAVAVAAETVTVRRVPLVMVAAAQEEVLAALA